MTITRKLKQVASSLARVTGFARSKLVESKGTSTAEVATPKHRIQPHEIRMAVIQTLNDKKPLTQYQELTWANESVLEWIPQTEAYPRPMYRFSLRGTELVVEKINTKNGAKNKIGSARIHRSSELGKKISKIFQNHNILAEAKSKTVVHGAGVCVIWNKKILLLRRSSIVHDPGLWNWPGGGVDKGENPRQAAIRECAEEIGKTFFLSNVPAAKTKDRGYVVFTAYTPYGFVPKLNVENDDYKFMDLDEAQRLPLHGAVEETLEQIHRVIYGY